MEYPEIEIPDLGFYRGMVKVYRHGYFDYKHWPTPDEFPNYPKVLDGGHGSVDDTPVGRRRCISIVDFDRWLYR